MQRRPRRLSMPLSIGGLLAVTVVGISAHRCAIDGLQSHETAGTGENAALASRLPRRGPPSFRQEEVAVDRQPEGEPQPTRRPTSAPGLSKLLERHQAIAEKALRLGSERIQFDAMLSDSGNLTVARDRLVQVPPAQLDETEEEERMKTVHFLTNALRFEANPARSKAVEAVRDVVLSTNYRATIDDRVRRSVVGDKIELFIALASHAPADAQALEWEARLSENQALLEYAAKLAWPERRTE